MCFLPEERSDEGKNGIFGRGVQRRGQKNTQLTEGQSSSLASGGRYIVLLTEQTWESALKWSKIAFFGRKKNRQKCTKSDKNGQKRAKNGQKW